MTVIKAYNSGTSAWEPVAVGADVSTTLTTKGDILTRTSSAATRQAVGTDGQALIADSTQTNGIKWGTPNDTTKVPLSTVTAAGDLIVGTGSGAVTYLPAGTSGYALTSNGAGATPSWQAPVTGAMSVIATANLTGTSSCTFSSIPQTYKSLKLVISNPGVSSSAAAWCTTTFLPNGWFTGASTGSLAEYAPTTTTATGYLAMSNLSSSGGIPPNLGSSSTNYQYRGNNWPNQRPSFEIWIPEYTNTDTTGTIWRGATFIGMASTGSGVSTLQGSLSWKQNGAVTSITIGMNTGTTYNWAGGTATLYGIA